MRDKSFGSWLKRYAIGFIFGMALIIVCLMCGQKAEAVTNMYAWVTNGAGENIYTGYITGWEIVPVKVYSKPSDFYIIVTGEDGYKYMSDMENVVIKYR